MAEVVIVGCKLPNGLLLNVGSKTIRINGRSRYNMPSPARPKHLLAGADVQYADGLTTVDKAFWDQWLSEHKDYQPVKVGHVYASANTSDATAKAKDTEQNKTGLEPIDPSKPAAQIEPTEEIQKVISEARKK